jgi:hypothetical protein
MCRMVCRRLVFGGIDRRVFLAYLDVFYEWVWREFLVEGDGVTRTYTDPDESGLRFTQRGGVGRIGLIGQMGRIGRMGFSGGYVRLGRAVFWCGSQQLEAKKALFFL